jgi:hypothetical protein
MLVRMVPLVVLALVVAGLLTAAVARVQAAAQKNRALNNLRQLGLALHNYNDVYTALPPGLDDKGFSAAARLLPFIEQEEVFNKIDFKQSIFAKANDEARKTVVSTFLAPDDPIRKVLDSSAPSNYLFNDKLFFHNSKARIPASFPDGLSNTIAIGETLKGDGGTKAVTVQRQYVLLPRFALTGIKPDAGVEEWKNGTSIGGDRCGCWMNGRFLQGTFNGMLQPNDERPDVSCAGFGGVSTLRSLGKNVHVALGDGSARAVSGKISEATWKNAMDPADGNPLGDDW